MATTSTTTVAWYDLIPEVPEPPEDGMQQDDTITLIKSILMARYADDPSVLVAGPSTNVIYNSDIPGSFVVPDIYVVFGVDVRYIRMERRSYRVDEWDAVPSLVVEVASRSTAGRDLNQKREIYAQMGVQEYWRFDAFGGEYYGEPLVGERLIDGEYRRIEQRDEPDGSVWSRSEVLGVDFYWIPHSDGYTEFRLKDAVSGRWLNTLDEAERSLTTEQQARREEQQARLAERRIAERRIAAEREARLAAEQARLAEEQAKLAERESRLAAEARAEQERAARLELEAELRRLRGE